MYKLPDELVSTIVRELPRGHLRAVEYKSVLVDLDHHIFVKALAKTSTYSAHVWTVMPDVGICRTLTGDLILLVVQNTTFTPTPISTRIDTIAVNNVLTFGSRREISDWAPPEPTRMRAAKQI